MGIFKRGSTGAFEESERSDAQEIDAFQKRIISLKQTVAMVEEHSGEYFQVLHAKGWSKVTERAESLELVSRDIDKWLKERRLDYALKVVRFISQGVNPERADEQREIVSKYGDLSCWESATEKLMLDVVAELGKAAEKTKNLGIKRAHKRQGTLTAVQELRRLLMERKEKKTTLEEW